jgi:hypothetical protein
MMVWIDRVPFPAVVGALAAGLAAGIWLSRFWLGLPGLLATVLVVGALTMLYLRDYLRRPVAVPVRSKPRPPAPPDPPVPEVPPVEPRRTRSEPVEPIPDDLSEEEDPVLEADRIDSDSRASAAEEGSTSP